MPSRPCAALHPDPARTAAACRHCALYLSRPDYRALWGGPPDPARCPAPVALPVCGHEGPVVEWARCGCEDKHVRDCELHDRCTRGPNNGSVASCRDCPEHTARPSGGRRHLLYHVYPRRKSPVWRRNLAHLRRHLGIFTGRRLVAVAYGPETDGPEEVAAELAGQGCEIIPVRNDPRLREVATWAELWSRVLPGNPGDVAFYGHAKGVSRDPRPGGTCHEWADVLYEVCLGHWRLALEHLKSRPVTGAFKKVGAGFEGSRSAWHYSGTFFWARCADVAARDWRGLDRVWWGAESWPGLAFRVQEAGCLFHEGRVPSLDLYSADYWRTVVTPAFGRWRAENAHRRGNDAAG